MKMRPNLDGSLHRGGIPLLLMHGLSDVTIDAESSAIIYESARGPRSAVFLLDADHSLSSRFEDVLAILLGWVPGLLRRMTVFGNSPHGQTGSRDLDEALLGLNRVNTL